MTGFNDSVSYPEGVVQPDAEAASATWVQDASVIVHGNLFWAAIVEALRGKWRHRYEYTAFRPSSGLRLLFTLG